jgi:hypothetical protein
MRWGCVRARRNWHWAIRVSLEREVRRVLLSQYVKMTLAESRPTLGRIARRNFVFQDMVREAANIVGMGFCVGRGDVAEDLVSNLNGKLGKEGKFHQSLVPRRCCGGHRRRLYHHVWYNEKGWTE